MFSILKIVYLTTLCLVLYINVSEEDSSCYSEAERHLKVRPGEHISISTLTLKKVKQSAESSIFDNLLFCNNDPSFDDFTMCA